MRSEEPAADSWLILTATASRAEMEQSANPAAVPCHLGSSIPGGNPTFTLLLTLVRKKP